MRLERLLTAALVVALSACDNTSPQRAQGNVRFLNGATPRQAGAGATLASVAAGAPIDGTWKLSPDKVALTLTRIMFFKGDGSSSAQQTVNCPVIYDKSKPGLTQLADCPFVMDTGTYTQVELGFKSTYDLFVDDPVNGFYTTSTGIVTAAPPNGAQNFAFTVPNATDGEFMPSPITLPTPVVVTDSTPLTLNVIVDGLQFFWATVNGTSVTTTGTTNPQRPGLVATVGTVAAVEYYSLSAVGTGGTYCAFHCGLGAGFSGVMSVAVYYTSATTPVMAGAQLDGTPACLNGAVYSFVQGARSYIGLDASGALGWALPADPAYATYAAEMRMARAPAVGSTTTLYCKARNTDPAPAGGSYASGAPAINQSANAIGTYVLVAK